MIKNLNSIKERVLNRKRRLKAQLESSELIVDNSKLYRGHERRMKNAAEFLNELEEVEYCMVSSKSLLFTSSVVEFERKLSDACMRWVTFDGNWCKLAIICEEMGAKSWLMFVSPVEKI